MYVMNHFRRLTEFTHVILDEVHDREEDLDFVLLLVKKFINTNSRGVKLILMSATLEVEKLQRLLNRLTLDILTLFTMHA